MPKKVKESSNGTNWTAIKMLSIMAMFGFLYSRPVVIKFLAKLDPTYIVLSWYVIWFIFIETIARTVTKSSPNFKWSWRYTLASGIVWFMLGIVMYFPLSDYSAIILNHPLDSYSKATEDQILWEFNYNYLGIKTVWLSGILTYVVEPFLMGLIVIGLVKPRAFMKMFSRNIESES